MNLLESILVVGGILAIIWLAGCGGLHRTRTIAGESDGPMPSNSAYTRNAGLIGPAPANVAETNDATAAGNVPQTIFNQPDGAVFITAGDITAEGLEIRPDGTIMADRFSSRSAPPMGALALQLEALGTWATAFADAQQARDEARAKTAAEAIRGIVEAIVKALPTL